MQCFIMMRAIIGRSSLKTKVVGGHVHVSDSRETLCDAENSTLPVDVDNREMLCDDEWDLRACSRER